MLLIACNLEDGCLFCFSSALLLDLFATVLNLPAFASFVRFAEPHERPDTGCIYSLLHRLNNASEGMRLLAHVCLEASKVPLVCLLLISTLHLFDKKKK